MDGQPTAIILQCQNAGTSVAGRIIFHHDGRRDPGHCVIDQNIILTKLRKAVLGNMNVASEDERLNAT